MRIALFGPPGAGKGTQAKLLVKRHALAHISTGEIIRRAIRADTEIGREVQKFSRAGQLVPDEIVRVLAEEAIAESGYDQFVLDGYPRTVQQAEWLEDFLDAHGTALDAVLAFILPEAVIIDRLSKRRVNTRTGENYHLDHKPPPPDVDPSVIIQRADDRPEAIHRRFVEYETKTQPVAQFYRSRGVLIEIDAVGEFDEVQARIEQHLKQVA